MPSIIQFKNGSNPQQVTGFIPSVDPISYVGRSDIKIYSDTTIPTESEVTSLVNSNPLRHLKVVSDDVQVMTFAERSYVDSELRRGAIIPLQKTWGNDLLPKKERIWDSIQTLIYGSFIVKGITNCDAGFFPAIRKGEKRILYTDSENEISLSLLRTGEVIVSHDVGYDSFSIYFDLKGL